MALSAIWIALEGNLARASLLAIALTVVAAGHAVQRFLGGRRLRLPAWLLLCSILGFIVGAGSATVTLALMAVKSGLHAHGPEFNTVVIGQAVERIPAWAVAGLLLGLGMGLLLAGIRGQVR